MGGPSYTPEEDNRGDVGGNKAGRITPPLNLTADYIGGKISVAGVEMSISDVSGNTVRVTVPADIPFTLHDDDDDSRLPHILTGEKMDDAFFDAYYLPTTDGGDNPANNQVGMDGVDFVRNLESGFSAAAKRDSAYPAPDNFWIIYVCSAWQYASERDMDPLKERGVTGVAPSFFGNDKVHKGGKTCWIFIESIYFMTAVILAGLK